MALVSATVLAEYLCNGAASGVTPSNLADNTAGALTLSWFGTGDASPPNWSSITAGRGMTLPAISRAVGAAAAIGAGRFQSGITGSHTCTLVAVFDWTAADFAGTGYHNLFGVNDAGLGGYGNPFCVYNSYSSGTTLIVGTDLGNSESSFPCSTGLHTLVVVIDSTQTASADRCKVYLDGTFVFTTGTVITLNGTFSIPTTHELFVGGTSGGGAQSPHSTTYYLAVTAEALTAANVTDIHASLIANNDASPFGSTVVVPTQAQPEYPDSVPRALMRVACQSFAAPTSYAATNPSSSIPVQAQPEYPDSATRSPQHVSRQSSLAPISYAATNPYVSPNIVATVLAEYLCNAASSGQSPATLADNTGGGLNLSWIGVADASPPVWSSIASGRGFTLPATLRATGASRLIGGSARITNGISGSNTCTLVAVINYAADSAGRALFGFNTSTMSTSADPIQVSLDGSNYLVVRGGTGVGSSATTVPTVLTNALHSLVIVIDTTQVTPVDRCKVYVDGVLATASASPALTQNATLSFGNDELFIGTTSSAGAVSPHCTMYYLAVVHEALTASNAAALHSALFINNDVSPFGVPPQSQPEYPDSATRVLTHASRQLASAPVSYRVTNPVVVPVQAVPEYPDSAPRARLPASEYTAHALNPGKPDTRKVPLMRPVHPDVIVRPATRAERQLTSVPSVLVTPVLTVPRQSQPEYPDSVPQASRLSALTASGGVGSRIPDAAPSTLTVNPFARAPSHGSGTGVVSQVLGGFVRNTTLAVKDRTPGSNHELIVLGVGDRLYLYKSGDNGATWSYVDPTAGESIASGAYLKSVAQDSAGKLHLLYWSFASGTTYSRIALTYTSGVVTGFSSEVKDVVLPGTYNNASDVWATIQVVYTLSGVECLAALVTDSVTGTNMRMQMVKSAGLTPAVASDFTSLSEGAGTTVLYTEAYTNHEDNALFAQLGATHELWVFYGSVIAEQTLNSTHYYTRMRVYPSGATTWAVDAPIQIAQSAQMLTVVGTTNYVWCCSNWPTGDALRIDRVSSSGTFTTNVFPGMTGFAEQPSYAAISITPDEQRVFAIWNTWATPTGPPYYTYQLYYDGTSWTRFNNSNATLDDTWGGSVGAYWDNGALMTLQEGVDSGITVSTIWLGAGGTIVPTGVSAEFDDTVRRPKVATHTQWSFSTPVLPTSAPAVPPQAVAEFDDIVRRPLVRAVDQLQGPILWLGPSTSVKIATILATVVPTILRGTRPFGTSILTTIPLSTGRAAAPTRTLVVTESLSGQRAAATTRAVVTTGSLNVQRATATIDAFTTTVIPTGLRGAATAKTLIATAVPTGQRRTSLIRGLSTTISAAVARAVSSARTIIITIVSSGDALKLSLLSAVGTLTLTITSSRGILTRVTRLLTATAVATAQRVTSLRRTLSATALLLGDVFLIGLRSVVGAVSLTLTPGTRRITTSRRSVSVTSTWILARGLAKTAQAVTVSLNNTGIRAAALLHGLSITATYVAKRATQSARFTTVTSVISALRGTQLTRSIASTWAAAGTRMAGLVRSVTLTLLLGTKRGIQAGQTATITVGLAAIRATTIKRTITSTLSTVGDALLLGILSVIGTVATTITPTVKRVTTASRALTLTSIMLVSRTIATTRSIVSTGTPTGRRTAGTVRTINATISGSATRVTSTLRTFTSSGVVSALRATLLAAHSISTTATAATVRATSILRTLVGQSVVAGSALKMALLSITGTTVATVATAATRATRTAQSVAASTNVSAARSMRNITTILIAVSYAGSGALKVIVRIGTIAVTATAARASTGVEKVQAATVSVSTSLARKTVRTVPLALSFVERATRKTAYGATTSISALVTAVTTLFGPAPATEAPKRTTLIGHQGPRAAVGIRSAPRMIIAYFRGKK